MSERLDPNASQPATLAQPAEARSPVHRAVVALLLAIGIGLSIIPPLLVVLDRWLKLPVRDLLISIWCRIPWLCRSTLPSYFLWIIPAFGLFILFFLAATRPDATALNRSENSLVGLQPDLPGKVQRRIALAGMALTGFTALVSLLLAWQINRLPGIELALAVIVFLLAGWLREIRLDRALAALKRGVVRLLPPGIGLVVLILFLRSAAENQPATWITGLLLAVVFYILLRRRLAPPVYWVFCAALALMCFRIGYWQFSVIGDEYSFYSYAGQQLQNENLIRILNNLFQGSAVYGAHPYFSTVLQMASMALLGVDNFGWRFSSIFLAAFSLFFFYDFFKNFLSERAALWGVIFLGAAQYLMTFGKIGYNNLQALFGLGLVLWAAARAVRSHSYATYAGLGAAMGLCFFLYPAAIYAVPLAWLFLLIIDPPWKRQAPARWGFALAGLAFFLAPLIFQPDYWLAKIPGTFLQRSLTIQSTPLAVHIGMNLLYSLFSSVYAPAETHYVVASYLDPLSAALLPAGLALTLRYSRRNRFALFWILGFLYMLFAAGATHDRETPSTTRMFMVLPWFCLFAALGLVWLAGALRGSVQSTAAWRKTGAVVLAGVLMTGMVSLNVYMAYDLSRQRTLGIPSLEVLFLRLLQRGYKIFPDSGITYTFITDPNWGIDGIRVQRDVYGLPKSQTQLDRVVLETPMLLPESAAKIAREDTLIIVQPWMSADLKLLVEEQLAALGKLRCDVRDAPGKDIRFTMWVSQKWEILCPWDAEWAIPNK